MNGIHCFLKATRLYWYCSSSYVLTHFDKSLGALFFSLYSLVLHKISYYLQSKDPRFHALPLASQRVAAFADTVNELVYDVLISKVRQRLSDVSRLPIWSSVEEQGSFPLPTFSAYPQSYVTSVGEYLLTLPQQLEPLAEGISNNEVNDEAQFFATEWMFKVTYNIKEDQSYNIFFVSQFV